MSVCTGSVACGVVEAIQPTPPRAVSPRLDAGHDLLEPGKAAVDRAPAGRHELGEECDVFEPVSAFVSDARRHFLESAEHALEERSQLGHVLGERANLDPQGFVDDRSDALGNGSLELGGRGLEACEELVAADTGRKRRQNFHLTRIRRLTERVDGGVDTPLHLFADGLSVDDAQDVLRG